MYADGDAEALVGEAIVPHREARRPLRRGIPGQQGAAPIDTIDLYLLHRPGPVPLEETVESFDVFVSAPARSDTG
jgi:aryl-alcohol dehydrogenase-like predicted oxidoreductase